MSMINRFSGRGETTTLKKYIYLNSNSEKYIYIRELRNSGFI